MPQGLLAEGEGSSMSMTMTTRRELYKLRELMHFILGGAGATPRREGDKALLCYFCEKVLDETDFTQHGEAVGPKFSVKLSIHHVNGFHDDQRMENKALSHTKCHKAHHRKVANALRREAEEE